MLVFSDGDACNNATARGGGVAVRPLNYLCWLESCVRAADSSALPRNPGTVLSGRTGRGRKRDVVSIPDATRWDVFLSFWTGWRVGVAMSARLELGGRVFQLGDPLFFPFFCIGLIR
jgi:hypothetical protein